MAYNPKTDYQALINKGGTPAQVASWENSRAEKIAASSASQLNTWGINSAGQNLSSVPVNGSVTLTPAEMNTLQQNNNNKNAVTIVDRSTGTWTAQTGYILDGHTYMPNASGGGTRLYDYDGSGGLYPSVGTNNWNPTDRGGFTGSTTVWTGSQNVVQGIVVPNAPSYSYTPVYYPPPPPPPPPFISFNEPQPTLNEDLEKVSKYSYFFGLDKLNIKKYNVNPVCCFVSQDIAIGALQDGEFLQLEALMDYTEQSSIEFYILDGGTEIPILPVSESSIQNEKVFYGIRQRFAIDESEPVVIKKNGFVEGVSLEKAIQSNDGVYTVSYKPKNATDVKPLSSTIKLKVIFRLYDTTMDAPSVTKMKIRKYGGDTLWKQGI